jgi:DNA-binding transcriptional regulator LsrR (DeoR family)
MLSDERRQASKGEMPAFRFDLLKMLPGRLGATAIDLLSDVGIKEADLRGAIGDLNYSFIDEQGQTRDHWRLFLSIQADQLHRMARNPAKHVVIIAGQHKRRILQAALRSQLLNVLITDEVTADWLLDPTGDETLV